MTDQASITFAQIMELAIRLGATDLYKLDGAWIHKLDENWTIALNGHKTKQKTHPENCILCDIPPFNAAIWWNGFLAGLLSFGGGTIAAGTEANEDAFLTAINKAIEETKI